MAAKHMYDLVVSTGEYKDASGATKKKWLTIGRVFEGDRGLFGSLDPFINLAGLPLNNFDQVQLSFFEPKQRTGAGAGAAPASPRPAAAPRQKSTMDDFDDDIPF